MSEEEATGRPTLAQDLLPLIEAQENKEIQTTGDLVDFLRHGGLVIKEYVL